VLTIFSPAQSHLCLWFIRHECNVNTVSFADFFPEISPSAVLMAPWAILSPEAQAGAWSGVSANCQTVREGGSYADDNLPMTVTLNDLTVSSNYLVQVGE